MTEPIHLRLGTRGSLLARTQSQLVASEIEKLHPHVTVELIIIQSSGDKIQDKPLHEFGGKGLFTKELEQALLRKEVDFAVHSFKDVPVTMPLVDVSELVIAAIPERENPLDAFVSMKATKVAELPQGAKVGTGSLRRKCQLLNLRPDLQIALLRGNIDTRIRKLREGEYDAVILAMAGLRRGGLFDVDHMFECPDMIPSAGQGALALQCRMDDASTRLILASMDDVATRSCVTVERDLVQLLQGDCHSPIGAFATIHGDTMRLQARVGARGGDLPVIAVDTSAPVSNAVNLSKIAFDELQKQGVMALLHGKNA